MFRRDEPLPVVGVAPGAAPTVCIQVNEQWVPLLIGVAEFMLWPDFWTGTGEEVRQAVSHAIELIGLLAGGSCGGMRGCTIFEEKIGNGGSSIVGAQFRKLNTVEGDTDLVELVGDGYSFRPIAGTYMVFASAPAYRVYQHRLWLVSVLVPAVVLLGQVAHCSASYLVHGRACCDGVLMADGSEMYKVVHWTNRVQANNGLGVQAADPYDERYAFVTLLKIG
jgi:hypothetical protein